MHLVHMARVAPAVTGRDPQVGDRASSAIDISPITPSNSIAIARSHSERGGAAPSVQKCIVTASQALARERLPNGRARLPGGRAIAEFLPKAKIPAPNGTGTTPLALVRASTTKGSTK